MKFYVIYLSLLVNSIKVIAKHPHNIAWYGGPLHMECELTAGIMSYTGTHIKENVVAIKAVSHADDVFVLTPRLKRGIIATFWLIVQGRRGVELQPFPELKDHIVGDCWAIQNAVDLYLDQFGKLWILDNGIIGALDHPYCSCPPKVVMINMVSKKISKTIDISPITEHSSTLQSIAIDYALGRKPYIYISDATKGTVLVHDTGSNTQWSVLVSGPCNGLQMVLCQQGLMHTMLIMVRLYHKGLLEIDTATLRRDSSPAPLRVFGEVSKPVVILGTDGYRIFLRHIDGNDVISWDTRKPYNCTDLRTLHSPGPRLTSTSVTSEPLKYLLVLDSNYAEFIQNEMSAYQRITFIDQLW